MNFHEWNKVTLCIAMLCGVGGIYPLNACIAIRVNDIAEIHALIDFYCSLLTFRVDNFVEKHNFEQLNKLCVHIPTITMEGFKNFITVT